MEARATDRVEPTDPGLRQRGVDYLLAAGAFLAGVLFVFRATVDTQLSRLHGPGEASFGYADLHGPNLATAADAWARGKRLLAAFEPIGARELVQLRSGLMMASVVITALVLRSLIARLERPRLPNILLGLFVVSSAAIVLIDLSLAVDFHRTPNPYDVLFPWLLWLPLVLLALIGLRSLRSLAKAVRNRYRSYRAAPASARLVFGVAVGFFALSNLGDIGAQVVDLMRRELTARNGWGELGQAMLVLGGLAAFGLVLGLLASLPEREGGEPAALSLIAWGAAITILGAALVIVGRTASAPLVLGIMVLAIGVFSRGERRKLFPRDEKLLRFAATVTVIGAAMLGLGSRFGHDRHSTLLGAGAVILVIGAVACAVTWLRTKTAGRDDEPLGVEAASGLALLGMALMAAVPENAMAVHAGLALAALGVVLLIVARQWFRPSGRSPDVLALALVVTGIVLVRLRPDGRWTAPAAWGDVPLLPHHASSWLLGGALALVGLIALRLTQGVYVPVVWGPKTAPEASEATERPADRRRIARVPASEARPEDDESSARVLVLAAFLPVAGLLVTSVRVLGAVLSTGEDRPLVLVGFQVALLALFPGLGWLITRSAPGWRPGALAPGALMAVALSVPILAGLSMSVFRSAATDIGSAVGPGFLLLAMMAWVGALAGCMRLAFSSLNQPRLFTRLGFERTPVIGLLVTWLLLTMVVGSPYEHRDATSHHVRVLERSADRSSPAPCRDSHGVLATLQRAAQADGAMAQELCRWVEHVLVQRAGDPTIPQGATLPLILVSASGGGVRAAAWTTRVLDCLMFASRVEHAGSCTSGGGGTVARANRWPYVFAAGGASGGSVGIATAAATWLAPTTDSADARDLRPDWSWARDVAQTEHVGPVAGQMLISELGLAALGLMPEHDRAEVLIDSWSAPFGNVQESRCKLLAGRDMETVGFLEAAAVCPEALPLLLFNGTIVRNGQRFDISPLDGASLGLRDVLCQAPANARFDARAEDIGFFDAAFLSARFPFVTPSGRIDDDRACTPAVPSGVDVVDGGYHENSGTAQVAEVWNQLRPLLAVLAANTEDDVPPIRPVLLQIENGEIEKGDSLGCVEKAVDVVPFTGAGPAAPTEPSPAGPDGDYAVRFGEPLRVPWTGFLTAVRGRKEEVRDPLIDAMCDAGVPVLTMALYGHPGRALPLGWSLTDDVLDDLERVLALNPNSCRARAFVAFVDQPAVPPAKESCPPEIAAKEGP